MIVSGHTDDEVEAMDYYLDSLLHLPNMTVVGCQEDEGRMVLKLECLNETISCPHCGRTLDTINQTEVVLIRDLPVFGQRVYLQVPRRQFHCGDCQKFWTERLPFMSWRHHHTTRYEQAIYEQVKQTSLEAVSRTEGLGPAEVKTIFEQQAALSIKKSRACPNG
jgi:transposase